MLHGCRADLILICLVYSEKDRNLYLYLVTLNLRVDYNIKNYSI